MTVEKKSNIISILTGIVAIGVVGIGSYSLGSNDSLKNLSYPFKITTKEAPSFPFSTPQNILTTCQDEILGVVLKIPSTWVCISKKSSDTDSTILLNSNFFNITISNGLYKEPCISIPYVYGYDSNCVVKQFYSTPSLSTSLYTYQGKNKEIYGSFINANNKPGTPVPWISIKYQNMENQPLSENQNNELIQILNSLSPIN